ncbi:DUF421 domain-containing protein [Paracoccus sp. MC1862]|uniref:DUF421 domain-containing protein n=1 Tax=Paracoccus sp. MC1862 TaxID=2760307 RepID=UPI0016008997|nr:YetF domain-containing protein [Paracoccus sp. MC1862]MBB1498278.1 DUF421 domain-containing protein [Paracoccus sp. MC1862]QQO44958.1 DUF421 domain-containing protein [Paracoccus sp. MC1862]
MEDPVIPFDLTRMFLGQEPFLFYAEIAFRTFLIYGYTLALIRWIGGRSVTQLSMVDLILVIALGSAVGDATFYPDVPLLQAMLVITVIVCLNKLIDNLIERYDHAKRIIDGRTVAVVRDGRIDREGLVLRDISALELKSLLRLRGISNLGQVESAFHESGGGLSVFHRETPVPGLPIVPPDDVSPPAPLATAAPKAPVCCVNCGTLRVAADVSETTGCPDCGRRDGWTPAVTPGVARASD